MGKRLLELEKKVDRKRLYTLEEAVPLVKANATAKFDETIELHMRLGVDPKQSDQTVRGTVLLPHGTGRNRRVAVVAKGEKLQEAEASGADTVGYAELIDKIQKGWVDFDVLVATPDAMKDLTRLGKTLGPKGLMPNPKAGTVTFDIAKAVKELKLGRVEFKADDSGLVHAVVGKASFEESKILENVRTLWQAVASAKPASSKGPYILSATLSSTMGPGIPLNPNQKVTSV